MCTAIELTVEGGRLFGRTLDWFVGFGEEMVFTPRGFAGAGARGLIRASADADARYAILGMATVADGYPLYADGMNERGLAAAGLRFAGHARYAADGGSAAGERDLAPWEMLPYLLGRCADVGEVRAALEGMRVVQRPFYGAGGSIYPTAPLHWMVTDGNTEHAPLVIEAVAEGLKVYDASAGVMANAPDYPAQLAGLRRYAEAAAKEGGENERIGEAGTEAGESESPYASARATPTAVSVPGGYTSEARFWRAARLRAAMEEAMRQEEAREEAERRGLAVGRFFSLMAAVAPPLGAEVDAEGRAHRTLYTACMDLRTMEYHHLREGAVAVRSVGFGDVGREERMGDRVVRL